MPHIAQYSRTYWYPNGTLAASIPARIFPVDSNVLATLYTDATGTVQAPNPVTTTPGGVLSFFAEEGEYWVHIDSETFRISVGSPDFDLPEVVAGTMSTGIIAGGEITVNGSNPQAIDVSPFTGYVVDEITNPDIPAVTRVHSDGFTGVPLSGASLARVITWWLVDSSGTLIQQAARPDAVQRRTHLVLGVTAYDSTALEIFGDQSIPVIGPQLGNQFVDLLDALGGFVINGCVVTPNGANLSLALSAGNVFVRGFNHFSGPTPTRNPHVSAIGAQPQVSLRRLTRTPQFPLPPAVLTINPTQYDNNGVLTAVTGNDATIQRVWLFPANDPADQIAVQYGQHLYADFQSALDAVGSGIFVPNPTTEQNAVLLAHVIVVGNATALNNPAQCIIKRADKLSFP